MTSQKTMLNLLLVCACLWLPTTALAATYLSVGADKAILYNGPSTLADKRFVVRYLYPLELIVKPANGWAKVRDTDGGLYFIQADKLAQMRTLLVRTDNVELKLAPTAASTTIARIQKQVVILLHSAELKDGWLQVRTTTGQVGYVLPQTVWGY